jgi:hypothetical protein
VRGFGNAGGIGVADCESEFMDRAGGEEGSPVKTPPTQKNIEERTR